MADNCDFVVIGSGAAGSVVASRLAASGKHSVCVLEAGDDRRRPLVSIPAGFVKNLHKPEMMWQFGSVAGANTANRSVYLPQGKLVGGSTSINGLIYNRGQADDYDHWASLGNPGWAYNDILPYFRRSETRLAPESQYRGSHGPIKISDPDQSHFLCDAFIDCVSKHTGAPQHNDYNGATQRGTGYYQRFIHGRFRESAATAFLKPVQGNRNVEVRSNSLVTRIQVEQGRATGVEYLRNGISEKVSARCEVIVCAGTVNSARLLQLSGIGRSEYLQSLGVVPVHNLPGVGENLQDHYFVRLAARLKPGTDTLNRQSKGWRLGREVLRWLAGKPSILTWSPSIAYAFLNSADETNAGLQPDLQFVFSHGSYRPGKVYELDDFPAVTCGFTQQRPESTGYSRITSADPHELPEVQPNYLVAELDQQVAIKGIRMARRFLQSEQFGQWFEREETPGQQVQTDDEMLSYARSTGNTGYHLVGTCRMGPRHDPGSVVGADLKLHGLQGLRVIDASVMPRVTSSNTCAPTIMIAEKGVEMVLAEH